MNTIDNNLDHLNPDFRVKVDLFLADARKIYPNVSVFEGYRSADRQQYLYSIGRTIDIDKKPVTWTLESKHLTGQAIDIIFMQNGVPTWQGDYLGLRKIADKYGITNLGNRELCHFEDNLIPIAPTMPTTDYSGILDDLIKGVYKPVFNDYTKDTIIKQLIEIALARKELQNKQ